MVELNFVKSTETPSFKDGANIRLSVIVDILENKLFNNSESYKTLEELFNQTSIYNTFGEIYKTLGDNMEEYNPATLIQAIDKIVKYDPQMYYDIICIMRTLIEVANTTEKNNFIHEIADIFNNEDYVKLQNNEDKPSKDSDKSSK